MSFQFSPDTQFQSPNSLIPAGTLSLAVLKVRKLKHSTQTGGEYADIELTLDGEFKGRKLWPMIANPSDTRNNETWRQMGMAAIQHACEACALFVPSQPDTYQRFANASFVDVLTALDGKFVAVKVGVEKGTGGYQDKNVVVAWLTPNPASSESKLWTQLFGNPVAPANGTASQPAQSGLHQPSASLSDGMNSAPQNPPVAPAAQGGAPSWLT